MNELNHLNGKGDKERSPGWRDNYPEITGFGTAQGFERVNAARTRKVYGQRKSEVFLPFEISTPVFGGGTITMGQQLTSPGGVGEVGPVGPGLHRGKINSSPW